MFDNQILCPESVYFAISLITTRYVFTSDACKANGGAISFQGECLFLLADCHGVYSTLNIAVTEVCAFVATDIVCLGVPICSNHKIFINCID